MSHKNYIVQGAISHSLIGEVISRDASGTETGGISVFAGQVRADIVGGRSVSAIEYSCYESMLNDAVGSITDIVLRAFSDVKSVTVMHSTGVVKAGEISLLVVVTAGHRDHAMRACNHTVELVKERLPVWKKELFDDEGHRWV
ncbi:MAG: molybdenum cofactor biosynthesis protein MoaE [Bacteroidales bacterium]|nr:molybdenum cofactor biosynthesis protein MoaE [Bacteroidales bacterium]